MTTVSSLQQRVDLDGSMAALALGDIVAISLFVVAGALRHGVDPVTQTGRVVGTLIPFLVGMAIAAIVGSLYTRNAISTPIRAVAWVLPAWVLAVAIAQALRASAVFPGNANLEFAAVSVLIGGFSLVVWRTIASYVL